MTTNKAQTLAQLQGGALKGAVSLKISEGLTEFPTAIFDLADTLEVLDLSGNQLRELPADFGRLKKLRIFFCSNNLFTTLPAVLAHCPALDVVGFKANIIEAVPAAALNTNLRWLILTDNRIAELPAAIGNCSRMQKLMLAGNCLATLPRELASCSNLGLLRISANRLQAFPAWLLSMPRLAWLAFSGNPFCSAPAPDDVPLVHWNRLTVGELLGEGASGFIYRAALDDNAAAERTVAVKVFKGSVTSDGYPADEMNAFIAAGRHAGLPRLMGRVAGHPEGRDGLVMALIDPRFRNLGLPPSMASCTRDVFGQDASLSLPQAVKIAGTVAAVARQLHSRGLMHGDLYAHNTLTDDEGHALMSDFGAASFYPPGDAQVGAALERLEVLAYGYFVDDLLGICRERGLPGAAGLERLRDACLQAEPQARPLFAELCAALEQL